MKILCGLLLPPNRRYESFTILSHPNESGTGPVAAVPDAHGRFDRRPVGSTNRSGLPEFRFGHPIVSVSGISLLVDGTPFATSSSPCRA